MKTLLLTAGITLSLTALSFASVSAPKSADGSTLGTLDFVGAKACVVDQGASTTGKTCATGRGLVYGFMTEGDAAANFVVLFDSAASAPAIVTPSSFSVITSTGGTNTIAGGNSLVLYKFPVPVQFTNGLFAKPNATIANNGMWTLLYRPLAATE